MRYIFLCMIEMNLKKKTLFLFDCKHSKKGKVMTKRTGKNNKKWMKYSFKLQFEESERKKQNDQLNSENN